MATTGSMPLVRRWLGMLVVGTTSADAAFSGERTSKSRLRSTLAAPVLPLENSSEVAAVPVA